MHVVDQMVWIVSVMNSWFYIVWLIHMKVVDTYESAFDFAVLTQ